MSDQLEKLARAALNKLSKEELIDQLSNKMTVVEMMALVEKDYKETK